MQQQPEIQMVRAAAQLLYHVKDIRDELGILKAVATHQKKVQNDLRRSDGLLSQDNLPASYIIDYITEMDMVSQRIHAGVSCVPYPFFFGFFFYLGYGHGEYVPSCPHYCLSCSAWLISHDKYV